MVSSPKVRNESVLQKIELGGPKRIDLAFMKREVRIEIHHEVFRRFVLHIP